MTTLALLVPGGDQQEIEATLDSLRRQDYTRWQAVLATPGSSDGRLHRQPRTLAVPVDVAPDDPDLRARLLAAALAATHADFVAVVGAGDEIEPGTLAAVAQLLDHARGADLLYTDEQWPGEGASGIARKPDYLPRLLESYPYVGRLAFIRRDALLAAGGFLTGTALAEEYDLALRVTEAHGTILHLPIIGLTRRRAPSDDQTARRAAVGAVERRLERTARVGRVEESEVPLGTRTWLEVTDPPLVSIIVPTAGGTREVQGEQVVLVEQCVRSLLEATTYGAWELILVTSAHTPPDVITRVQRLAGDRLRVAPVDGAFNFSYSVNEGARLARGTQLLLLNDDTRALEPRWLERMVSVAADADVGAVGAKLLFENGTIQHVGVTFDDGLGPIHALGSESDGIGPWAAKVLDTDWSAVTGACLLTPRDLFVEIGGFCEDLPLNFNDLDYCFKVRGAGRQVVTTPFARLWHFESATRGHRLDQWEVDDLNRSWYLPMRNDPHLNYRGSW